MNEKLKKYPSSQFFRVIDTIGVPHPYCIGTKHVVHASDKFMGMLGKEAIEDGEKHGIYCNICKGKLKYADHKQALLIECDKDDNITLQEYLKSIVELAESDNFAGFSFIKSSSFGG